MRIIIRFWISILRELLLHKLQEQMFFGPLSFSACVNRYLLSVSALKIRISPDFSLGTLFTTNNLS